MRLTGTEPALPPLILTVELEPRLQAWAQQMRDRHFPPDRNIVPAHITMFHALPPEAETIIQAALSPRPRPGVVMDAPFLLGRGVAYRIRSPEIAAIREDLVSRFSSLHLTAQDRAVWRPHLTIQNKVQPEQAQRLHEELGRGYSPVRAWAQALCLWRYLAGPWELLTRFPFDAEGSEGEVF